MRLLDVNILVYAAIDSYAQHDRVLRWLQKCLASKTEKVAFPWETIAGFVRIVTNERFMKPALTVSEAWDTIEKWLSAPAAWIPVPTPRHIEYFRVFMRMKDMGSKLVADAQLAALACEHGLTLVSADADFKKFDGLRVENPVVAKNRK